LFKKIELVQEELKKLIKLAISVSPIDLGRFTVNTLKNIFFEVKEELGLDFDDVKIHPAAQPRESSDVEFIKDDIIIQKLNVKTAVTGNLRNTIRNLIRSLRANESGAIIFSVIFFKEENMRNPDVKLVIVILPEKIFNLYGPLSIEDAIKSKLELKLEKKGYKKYEIFALNEAIALERLKIAVIALENSEASLKEATEARKEAAEARKEAAEARKEAAEARKEAIKANKNTEEIMKELKIIKEFMNDISNFMNKFGKK